jgi:xanthine dehydrogenase accessory factor
VRLPGVGLLLNGVNPDRGKQALTWVDLQPTTRRIGMLDILPDIEKWRENGERVAVATVVSMAGSAPRRPGAKLAVSEKGELSGSVSGGCVEPAVVDSAMEVIKTGKPQMLEFGISEEDNFEKIGLACGGTIRVFVERLDW